MVVSRLREIIEQQQYDDLAFWKNSKLLREKRKLTRGAELHGSALAMHGKGIIVSGASESGKTTAWSHLLRLGGRAISEDLTNIALGTKALLVAPRAQHAFRIHGKFHRMHSDEPPGGVIGTMRSGRSIPNYPPAPLDEEAQTRGRQLNLIFYLEKQRLHPKAGTRVVAMDQRELTERLANEESTTFPSLFHDSRTHSRSSVKALPFREKVKLCGELVDTLHTSGVHFFKVYIPNNVAAQGEVAKALADFSRGFNGRFKSGLNLLAINGSHAGEVFPIAGKAIVGRSGSIKIRGDDWMEARHAEIAQSAGTWFVRDLESSAHTHILKHEREKAGKLSWRRAKGTVKLEHGDLLAIGHTFFQVVMK